ncbi:hypothetical protein RHMOL_Rhmol13G0279800 [Rhododendron molle]|uniref:Uncharacterized protein n=1 Tax=Rhododendron molle TaxID=49168 RepID=A0ACC0LD44_RHOML|nr:hypothetical protein RHMOL_Rhmol13G0279800 [Rhododendron molle]
MDVAVVAEVWRYGRKGGKTQGSVHKSTSLPADVTSSAEEYGIASLISEPVTCPPSFSSNSYKFPPKDDYWRYIPLYQAALRGDWASAKTFFDQDKDALTAKINEYSETALYVAAGAGKSSKSIDFIKNLVDKMSPEALELRDLYDCTPLHIAAWVGNTEAVKVLLEKHFSLLYIRGSDNLSALDMAARNAKKDTLLYLLEFTKDVPFDKLFPDEDSAAHFLILVMTSGYYGKHNKSQQQQNGKGLIELYPHPSALSPVEPCLWLPICSVPPPSLFDRLPYFLRFLSDAGPVSGCRCALCRRPLVLSVRLAQFLQVISKLSNQNGKRVLGDQQFFTLYVGSLPEDVGRQWLWKTFNNFGVVKDVYIPLKRSRVSGNRFGFVRYNCSVSADVAILRANGLWIHDKKHFVKRATFE